MGVREISLRSRRRHDRVAINLPVQQRRGLLFRKTTDALLVDANHSGFQLQTRSGFNPGERSRFRFSAEGGWFTAECLWASTTEGGAKCLSGWGLIRGDRASRERFLSFIKPAERQVKIDRRQQAAEGDRKRVDDIVEEFQVAVPEAYPVYRRTSARRQVQEPKTRSRRQLKDRRKTKVHYETRGTLAGNIIKSLGIIVRDALIPHMPNVVVRQLVGKGEFVFIAHPRDQRDVVRMFPFAQWMPEAWVKRWFKRQKPFIASRITGLKDKHGKPVNGWFLIAPRWTVQMMKDTQMARGCIADTVKLAEKIGAKIAGLGAFTSIVTHDGTDLLQQSSIGLTTGNPLSAAIAVQNAVKAASLIDLDLNHAIVAIIGAGGSVGSGCARVLAKHVERLWVVDINKASLETLVSSIPAPKAKIEKHYDLSRVREADIVIVATNSPGVIVHEFHLKPGAIVIDCAQPKNVSDEVPAMRDDVLVIESAIIETPGIDCHFDLDLNRNEALGCLAETMVLTSLGWPSSYAIGKSQDFQVEEIYAAARRFGFRLAYFRNSKGLVTEAQIQAVRQIVQRRLVNG